MLKAKESSTYQNKMLHPELNNGAKILQSNLGEIGIFEGKDVCNVASMALRESCHHINTFINTKPQNTRYKHWQNTPQKNIKQEDRYSLVNERQNIDLLLIESIIDKNAKAYEIMVQMIARLHIQEYPMAISRISNTNHMGKDGDIFDFSFKKKEESEFLALSLDSLNSNKKERIFNTFFKEQKKYLERILID